MWPSASSTTPVPRPPLLPDCTVMVTTEGSILAAAAATVPSRTGVCAAGAVLTLIGAVTGPRSATRVAYEPMPAPAPIIAASAAAATTLPNPRRLAGAAAGGVGLGDVRRSAPR